jgi:hypothetical protein
LLSPDFPPTYCDVFILKKSRSFFSVGVTLHVCTVVRGLGRFHYMQPIGCYL